MSLIRHLLMAGLLASAPAALPGQDVNAAQDRRIEALERQLVALRRSVDSLAPHAPEGDPLLELRRQLDAITRQLETFQLGREVVVADTASAGLGPAASKVYRGSGVSVGGYGEALYQNVEATLDDGSPSGAADRIDLLRAIVYLGYRFGDRTLFNSEVEFEHASTEGAGEVSVEFAYLEHRFREALGLRAGLLLMPVGFLNELHEPTTFLSTARPETERAIIPSTWREVGIGVFGAASGMTYRAYLVGGLAAAGGGAVTGYSAEGLREARQHGSEALAENLAVVARLDYVGLPGLIAGTSVYLGNAGEGTPDPGAAGTIGARTVLWEGHAHVRRRGLWVRGLVAVADVNDVAALNQVLGYAGAESIGERLVGYYVEGGYDVLRGLRTSHELTPFVRYEWLNTQERVPPGFAADPANDQSIVTLGALWKPAAQIAVKADYRFRSNEAGTGLDQWSVGVGYLF